MDSLSPEVRFLHVDAVAILVQDQLHLAALDIHAAALLAQAGTVAIQLLHSRQLAEHFMVLLPFSSSSALPASKALISEYTPLTRLQMTDLTKR